MDLVTKSSTNKMNKMPAVPIAPQHNHFSIDDPLPNASPPGSNIVAVPPNTATNWHRVKQNRAVPHHELAAAALTRATNPNGALSMASRLNFSLALCHCPGAGGPACVLRRRNQAAPARPQRHRVASAHRLVWSLLKGQKDRLLSRRARADRRDDCGVGNLQHEAGIVWAKIRGARQSGDHVREQIALPHAARGDGPAQRSDASGKDVAGAPGTRV